MSARELPLLNPRVIAVLSVGAAALCGLAMAVRPAAGMGFALALLFVPIALLDLRLALILWTPIPFFRGLPEVWIGPTFASLVVLVAWLGVTRSELAERARRMAGARGTLACIAVFILWLTVSLGRTAPGSEVVTDLIGWYTAALIAVVFATTIRRGSDVRMVAVAFIVGAAVSIGIGLVSTGLAPAASAIDTATFQEGRLQGGTGDPNYLASGVVAAVVLAAGLLTTRPAPLLRLGLLAALSVLAVGLAATQSRGGFVALLVAGVAGVAVARGHRLKVVVGLLFSAAIISLWLLATPGAWERILQTDGGGTGRTELWTVAWRVAAEHPIAGVGLGDFPVEAAYVVREPGQLEWVALIVDTPHVAHNTYLQMFAETGIIGAVLFAAALLAFLFVTFRAGTRLRKAGHVDLATLARAVFVAQLAALTANVFLTNGTDQRIWVLMGLGLALNAIAADLEAAGHEVRAFPAWESGRAMGAQPG